MEVEITVAIMGSISSIVAVPVSGTSMETGGFPLGGSTSCQAPNYFLEPQGHPFGSAPLPSSCHGLPALGSLWMRLTWKYPQGPAILLLRGVRFFYITWNYGCSTANRVLQVGRVHFPQWPPFGRNEPLPIFGYSCPLLSILLARVGRIGQLIHGCSSGGNQIFQSSQG